MRKVELIKQSAWAKAFEQEACLLTECLGGEFVALHHIGSTAIPGIFAKPVIDMIMEVKSVQALDTLDDKFKALGYEPKGEFGIPGRRFFPKGGEQRSHHLHAFAHGSNEVLRHLALRDYLVAHRQRAKDYERLKLQLAKKYRTSPQAYSAGKHELIQEIEREALAWSAANGAPLPSF